MAERCVVAAETLDRYRQAVPDFGRVAHRQSGGLQNRAREGSIPSSPANLPHSDLRGDAPVHIEDATETGGANRVEQLANAFASALLMPAPP